MIEIPVLAGKLLFSGIFLGIGFWASKKLTNLVDEKLILYDSRKLQQLAKEMGLDNGGNNNNIR